jgi:hypothetical protein
VERWPPLRLVFFFNSAFTGVPYPCAADVPGGRTFLHFFLILQIKYQAWPKHAVHTSNSALQLAGGGDCGGGAAAAAAASDAAASDSVYRDVFVTSLAEFPGLLVAALILDKIGR